MTQQGPIPLSDLTSLGDEPPAGETVEPNPHPGNPDIQSPADAIEHLRQQRPQPQVDAAAGAQRCAWLTTSGGGAAETYVLNWSGPQDSSYDWIGFAFDKGPVIYVCSAWYNGACWQWAEKGSPYTTNWTPYDVSNAGGTNPRAIYFIWDANQSQYMAQPACDGS
jgi:hypothetical protein